MSSQSLLVPDFKTLYEGYQKDISKLEADLARDLAIDPDDVYSQMLQQPSKYFYWARLSTIAGAEYQALKKMTNERVWNGARQRARAQLEATAQKVTEGRVDEIAFQDQEYLNSCGFLSRLEEFLETLRRAENAMWMRKDMLQSTNSRQRAELNNA